MQLNIHPTSVPTIPALTPQDIAAQPGYFTKGNPSLGVSPTVPTAAFMNGLTQELVNVISETQQTLDVNKNTQLVTAISSISKRYNVIINGDFDVWSYGTVANNPLGYATADRWITLCSGTQVVFSQNQFFFNDTDGLTHPVYFMQAQVTAGNGAGDHAAMIQVIEGVSNLSGKVVTLSFWAKCDAPSGKSMAAEVGQTFGTGGAPSPLVRKAIGGQVQLTNVWQRYSFTGTLPSVQGKTIGTNGNDGVGVVFYFDSGSDAALAFQSSNLGHQSGVFWLARVQLELGSFASDFVKEPIAVTVAQCQRYHVSMQPGTTLTGQVNGAGSVQGHFIKFPQTMRQIPTVTLDKTGIGYQNISDIAVSSASTDGCNLYTTATTTAPNSLVSFGTPRFLRADAELYLY